MPDLDVATLRAKYTQTQLAQMAMDVERAIVYLTVAHLLLSSVDSDLTALGELITVSEETLVLLRAARDG